MNESALASGRVNQKARTRQAIVRAAGALLARGDTPSLDDVAAEAKVSRATAYRYFPGLDALLGEAAVDLLLPEAGSLFDDEASGDVADRLALVDETCDRACRSQEAALRLMLARMLERSAKAPADDTPLRQNRRVPLIREALAPVSDRLRKASRERLEHALAMIVGTEGFIALTDVVGLDEKEARAVRRWAIEALLAAATKENEQT